MMSFFNELQQRKVIRGTALYLAASWLVLQVADLVFEAFQFPSWSMRLLITILTLGLPAVVVLSWVYDITRDGLKKESEVDPTKARGTTNRSVTIAIAVLVLLAVTLLAYDRSQVILDDANDESIAQLPVIASIAVMPFVNVSDEPGNDYFSDGLSSELLNLLADVPELQVMARSASFFYKGKAVDPRSIGQQLNVAHILEGEVRRAGDQLRISVWLINTETAAEVWHDTYDRTMADVFSLQNDLASMTVEKLRVTILGEPPRVRETDPVAYDAYLTGQYFYNQRTSGGYVKAIEYLLRATEIDPAFAPAWTTMSSAYLNLTRIGEIPYEEGHVIALEAIEKALQIDPDSANANSARGWVAMTYEHDYPASATYFSRALRLAPRSSLVLGNAAILAVEIGRVDRSIELADQSLELNPISSVGYANRAAHLFRASRFGESIASSSKALELKPDSVGASVNLALAYLLGEQPELALAQAARVQAEEYKLYIEALAHHSLGQEHESKTALATFENLYPQTNGFEIACTYAWLGNADASFDWLERVIAERKSYFGLKTEPLLRSLHNDPRWEPLLLRLGLADSQLEELSI